MLGHSTRGGTLMALDILTIFAFVSTDRAINLQTEQYMNYADRYAGASYGRSDALYQNMQDFISSDYYNDLIEMIARNYYLIANYSPEDYEDYIQANSFTEAEAWAWDSEAHWDEYKDMRKSNQRKKMSHNLALGVLLLNRAVSVIDTALLSRSPNPKGQAYFSPSGNDGLMFNYSYNF